MRKYLSLFVVAITLMFAATLNVSALTTEEQALIECLAGSETECKLDANLTLTEEAVVKGTKTLNLNGFKLTVEKTIKLDEANLTVTGNGEVYSEEADIFSVKPGSTLVLENGTYKTETKNGSVIWVKGAETKDGKKIEVTVKKDAYLIANKPVGIGDNGKGTAYGVTINIYGKLEGITGNNEYKQGASLVYVNGNIEKVTENIPTINIYETAILKAGQTGSTANVNENSSPAIYAAGYAVWNITGGTFTGDEALSIKSGIFNISGGEFTATGKYVANPEAYGNGTEATGAAISITANDGYQGEVELSITGGTFTSENGYAVYEGDTDAGKDAVEKMVLTAGSFTGKEGAVKSVNETAFIEGGSYSEEIEEDYIADSEMTSVEIDGVHYVGNEYNVTVKEATNGTVSASVEKTVAGAPVKLTVEPKEGYKVAKIEFLDASGEAVDVEVVDGAFTMPEEDVTVVVTFELATNPDTSDNVMTFVTIAIISLAAVAFSSKKLRRN